MTDEPKHKAQAPTGGGEGRKPPLPPPPFEPDEDLITYLEKARVPKQEKQ